MKELSTTTMQDAENGSRREHRGIKAYFLNPVKGGIFGFTTFFALLFCIKYFSFRMGMRPKFNMDITDVILSLLGFILIFLIKFLENFQEKESEVENEA